MAGIGRLIFAAGLLLLLFAAPERAFAHTVTQCQGAAGVPPCEEGYAFAVLQTLIKDHCSVIYPGSTPGNVSIVHHKQFKRYDSEFRCRSSAGQWVAFEQGHYVDYGNTCDMRPDWNGPYTYLNGGKPKNGSVTCNAGCKQAWFSTGDGYFTGKYGVDPGTCSDYDEQKCKAQFGSGYYWNQAMSACEPDQSKCEGGKAANSLGKCEPEPCPEGMAQNPDGTCKKKDNECPAGQVKSPDGRCLPGEGQCAAGEVRGPDGTCKKDNDGDGEPDEPGEGEKEFFAGGDDCNSPPSCSGSPILCGQARIQWRIECNTRRNRNIAGGMCNTPPVCTGDKCDAMEYSSLLMQWRTACATEKLLAKEGGNGGEGGQPEWTKVTGMNLDPGRGETAEDRKLLSTVKIGVGDLDQSGIGGGGGSCPGFATGGGGGSGAAEGFLQVMASPPAFFCQYINAIKAVIILSASVVAVFILSRGGA